jgi:competence ComEA-like helix-hairpin-helix protein
MLEALIGEDDKDTPPDISFDLPLDTVLELLPEKYVVPMEPVDPDAKVTIVLDDLLKQLAKGKVQINVSELAFVIPKNMISSEALNDKSTMIRLPLQTVVGAIDMNLLKRRLEAKELKMRDISKLPNPFTEAPHPVEEDISEPVKPAAQPPEEKEVPAAPPEEPVKEEVEPEPEPKQKEPEPEKPEETVAETEIEPEGMDSLGGVNLNAADISELMTLEGVTLRVAQLLITHRLENGPFASIFDLQNIAGLGRKTFRKITGMPYSKKRYHRRRRLASLLNFPASKVSHLPTVAAALAGKPGFNGCIISDQDGMLLAQNGADEFAQPLSAIVPKMYRQLCENMDVVNLGHVDAISICIKGRMFTILAGRNVCLAAVHETNKVTRSQLVLARKVAKELAWLLSHRGYVGHPAP